MCEAARLAFARAGDMLAGMSTLQRCRPSLVLLASAVLALGGCGKGDNEPGPGGVTVGEAKALDEAAQMLEDERLPAEAVPAPREGLSGASAAKPAHKPAG